MTKPVNQSLLRGEAGVIMEIRTLDVYDGFILSLVGIKHPISTDREEGFNHVELR